jgi:hypothetical protein
MAGGRVSPVQPSGQLPWRIACLVLAPLQPLAGGFATLTGLGRPIGQMAGDTNSPLQPAGYAFAIWGVIFALSIAFGVWQALPAGRANPLAARLRVPLAIAFLFNVAWMLLAQLIGNGLHLVVVILVILAASLVALFRTAAPDPSPETRATRWLVRPLVGLLAGWVLAATFVTFAGVASRAGFRWEGSQGIVVALGLLAVFAIAAYAILDRGGWNPWVAVAVAWALVAIVVTNLARPSGAVAVAVACALLTAGFAFLTRRAMHTPLPALR